MCICSSTRVQIQHTKSSSERITIVWAVWKPNVQNLKITHKSDSACFPFFHVNVWSLKCLVIMTSFWIHNSSVHVRIVPPANSMLSLLPLFICYLIVFFKLFKSIHRSAKIHKAHTLYQTLYLTLKIYNEHSPTLKKRSLMREQLKSLSLLWQRFLLYALGTDALTRWRGRVKRSARTFIREVKLLELNHEDN